jgi:GDP-mannose 6-dehydrogenase
VIELIERLSGKGYDLRVYDKNVILASLVGANRDYILNRIQHISRLMVQEMDDVLEHAETVVIGNSDPQFRTRATKVAARAAPRGFCANHRTAKRWTL